MDLQTITAKMAAKSTTRPPIGNKVKFDFGSEGIIFVDGTDNNNVTNENSDADCTIHMEYSDFLDLINGNLNPMMAFMGGKLRIEGDMSVAMQLQTLL